MEVLWGNYECEGNLIGLKEKGGSKWSRDQQFKVVQK